ncbi:MAG: EAL domain-containing protein [Gammaproteobacteria bacterium]|nr:EAL domain-containing protein [Gammaproteobacteria bacterium]
MNRSLYTYNLLTLIALIVVSVTLTVVLAVVSARQQAITKTNKQLVNSHEMTVALLAERSNSNTDQLAGWQSLLKRVQTLTGVDVELKSSRFSNTISTRVDTDAKADVLSLSVPLERRGVDLDFKYSVSKRSALRDYREFALKLSATAAALMAITILSGAILLGFLNNRLIRRPLLALREGVSRVRQGVYTEDIPVHGQDIFGRLARAFNLMQSEIAERESRIVQHAEYDALTGLTNRAVVADRLRVMFGRAQRNGSTTAAMTIDIERFSDINGTLGTEIGDAVLKEVARRLASNTRATDLLARVGGDEFLIVIEDMEDRLTSHMSEFLAETLERPISVNGRSISLRVRIGTALFPDHCGSPEALRRLANVALTTAKETGQRVVMYEPGQDERHLRELAVLNDLDKAIAEGQLCLQYQPKIDMKTRAVEQVEALVRWHHPQLGFLPPDEFISLLEKHNKIAALTDWVLKTAVEQARHWASRGYDLRVAVNISANDLLDMRLSDRIGTLLHHYAVEAKRISVEITESAVMQDAEQATRVLHTLREIGIKVAVDDFGTGQTSLSLLKKLPLNELKIDKSFVRDLRADSGDGIIIKSTIDLGHNMGLVVVAEGVEDNYAWNLLKSYGCDSVQGYLVSKPLSAEDLEVWYLRMQARQASRIDFSFVDGQASERPEKPASKGDLIAEMLGD